MSSLQPENNEIVSTNYVASQSQEHFQIASYFEKRRKNMCACIKRMKLRRNQIKQKALQFKQENCKCPKTQDRKTSIASSENDTANVTRSHTKCQQELKFSSLKAAQEITLKVTQQQVSCILPNDKWQSNSSCKAGHKAENNKDVMMMLSNEMTRKMHKQFGFYNCNAIAQNIDILLQQSLFSSKVSFWVSFDVHQ